MGLMSMEEEEERKIALLPCVHTEEGPREDTVRRRPSASQEEGLPQEPIMQLPDLRLPSLQKWEKSISIV